MSIVDQLIERVSALIADDARRRLPGTALIRTQATSYNIPQLLFLGSWMATTDNEQFREAAYEVATRILSLDPGDVEIAACTEILIRLGNFPAGNLTEEKHGRFRESLPLRYTLENAKKLDGNTVTIGGRRIPLTDFQMQAEQRLSSDENDFVAISAPTSAGKSFLLSLDIARRFSREVPAVHYVCFVVPTRALSRQIAAKIREDLSACKIRDVGVRVLPPRDDADLPPRAIFVFTQERLLSLLGDTNIVLDVLYVDEAQGISDGSRGVLLQQAIEQALVKSPRCKVAVIAPMVRNPDIFGEIFKSTRSSAFFYTESLVTQNVFVVEKVDGKPLQCRFRLKDGEKWTDLGVRTLRYNFRPGPRKTKTIARFAIDITAENDVTLVYAPGPSDAEKIAEGIAEDLPESASEELQDLANFVRDEVHPEYSLAATLRKGVAFHYAMMPSLIRNRVEELVEDGTIKYVTATTTLLSGVNMPLKNLVIASPKKGPQHAMTGFEFWNLSGRAGRLGKEYHGNIWILKLDDWAEDVFESNKQIVVASAFETSVRAEEASILKALRSAESPVDSEGTAEASASKIFYDSVSTGIRFSDSHFAQLVSGDEIALSIDEEVERLREIPVPVAKSAAGISPARTLKLWQEMKSMALADLVPIHPLRSGSYERLRSLLHLLQRTLMGDESNTYKYLTKMANDWIQETPLNAMIAAKIVWDKDHSLKEVGISASVRGLLETIERNLRHTSARNFRLFAVAFQELCVERRQLNFLSSAAPIAMFLDSGAFREETLSLLSLGISRTSAIRIASTIRGQGQAGVAKLMSDESARRGLAAYLPKVCMDEVQRVARDI